MQVDKPKVLITGINGLIGQVIKNPLASFYDIYGIDIKPPLSSQVRYVDISDYTQVEKHFLQFGGFPFLIHLAATPSPDAPWETVVNKNIIGTRNVFEAARIAGVKRIVYASSTHVTGAYEGFRPHQHLHLEDNPKKITTSDAIQPSGEYGVSKAFGETLARYYHDRWAIEFVCLRIGTVRWDNDPNYDARTLKTWLSYRDLIHLVERSLVANVSFGIYYGVSNNKGAFWEIGPTREELGYNPRDDASRLINRRFFRRLLRPWKSNKLNVPY